MPAMPELAFVMSPKQNWFFHELVEAIRHELDAQGIASSLNERFPEPSPDRIYVLVPPHEYVALEGEEVLPSDRLLARTIFICAEQPGTVHFEDNVVLASRAGAVFDINPRSVEIFKQFGLPAQYLALGYTDRWDHFERGRERDIDVLFLGSHSPRRARYLNAYAPILSRWNCHLQISDNSAPNTGASTSFLTDQKWDLLSRTKVLLNLHQGEEPYFEWLRAIEAMHCGAVVVSEHSAAAGQFKPGQHIYFGAPESLGEMVDILLADPDHLAKIGATTHDYIQRSMPFAASVAELAGTARTLIARPIPVGETAPRPPAPSFVAASGSPPAAPDPGSQTSVLSLLRAGMKDTRLELLGLRRQLARMEATIRSPRRQPPPLVEHVRQTRGWEARRGATVTAVTALYNYRDLIGETLDSLAASGFADVEAVIVDDGSSDGSAEAVCAWMDAHEEIPALLVRHPINRGLGAARNTATDFARGRYCFVLDADNVLYPRCLAALATTLDADPGAAFAYPILEAFGMVDSYVAAGGSPLVSYFGWNPWRLRHANYIDALSMIRTETLRELGGYTTDRRLFGWEDYDLWCGIAEAGGYGTLVPQMLARYRVSPTSMRSLTNLSEADAMTALIERHPELMEGVLPRP
jgi:GT2 family glycosyltransferase